MSGTLTSATIGIQNALRDDGLMVAYNQDYVHDNLAIAIQAAPDWLSVDVSSGTVPPGGSVTIPVRFNATELIGGVYNGGLRVVTNDPASAVVEIPATLSVTGFPAIAASPAMVDFGTVFVGVTSDLGVVISNPGSDVLDVTGVTISGDYSTDLTPFSLAAGGSRTLTVSFAPTTDGTRTGEIVLESNATGMPTLTVPLTGEGLFPPIAGVDPPSFETALSPAGSKTKTLQLCNTGGSDLAWSADVELFPNAAEAPPPVPELDKGDDSADGTGVGIERTGGPDAFGYQFRDSDEPGGPTFDWFDISTIGTPILTGSSGDDVNVPGLPVGFDFTFYGNTFSTVNFCTNGWLSFTSTSTDLSNGTLPGTSGPENLLAAFHDDLDFNGGTKGHYYNDGSRFIVQYTDVEHYPSGSSYTFQVILYPDGTIQYQYLSMSGTMNSHTVGIQDSTRTVGLMATYNETPPYIHDGLAIEFFRTPDWLTVTPTSGVVPAGDCTDITLNLNSTGLEDGDWEAQMSILNNDPFNSLIDVPVLLHVGYTDLDYIDVEPNTLNLSSNGRTIRAALQLPPMYDPQNVVIETVSIGGQLYANPAPISYEDSNGRGRQRSGHHHRRGHGRDLVHRHGLHQDHPAERDGSQRQRVPHRWRRDRHHVGRAGTGSRPVVYGLAQR
jgi:hypothetical protein